MATLDAGHLWRAPCLSRDNAREEVELTIWRGATARLLLRLGLILLCTLLIWALILVVPVASGRLLA
jgi:hypothetical protein